MIDESKQRLYQVMQVGPDESDDFRVEQLEADAVNLNSNFPYILVSITVELTWIWKGHDAREEEVAEAIRVARLMSPYMQTVVEEGNEPMEVWIRMLTRTSPGTDCSPWRPGLMDISRLWRCLTLNNPTSVTGGWPSSMLGTLSMSGWAAGPRGRTKPRRRHWPGSTSTPTPPTPPRTRAGS